MEYAKVNNLILCCNELVERFSEKTDSYPMDVWEDKTHIIWSLKYKILKIQFLFTKKEKLMCPATTLYCRIFLGKNDSVYFHIPELVEYLDEKDFRCYYFPYIESEERLTACFQVLEAFLLNHMTELNRIAQDTELAERIKEAKYQEIYRVCDVAEKDRNRDVLEYWLEGYEKYVLLPRYTGEGAYREFLRGKYEKAVKLYGKSVAKNNHTMYEGRLLQFIEGRTEYYEAISEECASVIEIEQYNGAKSEGLFYLKGTLLLEVIFGSMCCLLIALINMILTKDTTLYYGTDWYWGFMIAALPAMFGSILFRRKISKILRGKAHEKAAAYDELVNTKFVDKLSGAAFVVVCIMLVVMAASIFSYHTYFYEEKVEFGAGNGFFASARETAYYKDLEQVIYSEGVYNDYGDFVGRPAYLLCFKDGAVLDLDSVTSVERTEEEILKMLDPYFEEVHTVKARNEYIE